MSDTDMLRAEVDRRVPTWVVFCAGEVVGACAVLLGMLLGGLL